MSIICIQSINEKKKHIRYEVDTDSQPLGVGGMGSVYRGKRIQEKTGVCVDVAIKFLFDDLPAHVIERARREASIQIHNENLVEMFGFIQIDEVVSPTVVHQHYHVVSENFIPIEEEEDVDFPFAAPKGTGGSFNPYDHNNRPMNNGTVAMDGVQGTEPGGTKFM